MKWLLILGVIVVLLFATGGIHFEFYSRTDPAPAAASSENHVSVSISAPLASSRLGAGRTPADVRWLRRMNTLCVQRNRRENALPGFEDTALALARYAAQTLWIWDDYQRRASAFRAPASYGAEAGWFQQVDALKRAGIESVLNAARSEDDQAAHAAISAFGDLSASAYPTLVKIGLAACGQFKP